MTLLTLLINIRRALRTSTWKLFNTAEPVPNGANPSMILISRSVNSADYTVEGEYDIDYVKGNEKIHMIWSDEAFRLDDPYVECDFSDMYEELKTFEASTGVDLLSEDWMLVADDFERVKNRVSVLEDVLYNPKEDKNK